MALTLVKSDIKSEEKKPLTHQELIAKLATKGTVQSREQVVLDNLKRMGF